MNFALLESLESKEPALTTKEPSSTLPAPPTSTSTSSKSSVSCMDCDQPATHFCARCGHLDLCSTCSSAIHQRRSAQNHTVVPLQDKPRDRDHVCDRDCHRDCDRVCHRDCDRVCDHDQGEGKGEGDKKMCAEHKEEVRLFCMDCKSVACAFCVGENAHEGHTMKDLAKAAKLQSLAIFNKLESFREFLSEIGKKMEEVRSEQDRLATQQQELSVTITVAIQDISDSLRQREQVLQRQLASKMANGGRS